jgi:putative ABC transport system permease protein
MRRFLATIRIALLALRRNKLRTGLTMLGMIIGVAAVIAAIGIGNGAKVQVEAQIASLGQNVVSVFPGSTTSRGARGGWGSFSTLVPEEAKAIAREIPGVVAVTCEVRDRQQVMASGLNWNTMVLGESPDYLSVRAWPMESGAMFTEADVSSAGKVAVVGKTIVDELFSGADPVGETLRIRNLPFKIVGVLKSKGVNFFGQDQDDVVLIPYTSLMRRVSNRQYLSGILIQASAPDQMARIQQELAQAATATSKTMTWLVGAIASISLLVGGIGIMNIMLVSVTERTREIGIRMAVGARGRDILLQFLTEAVTLSVLGGAVGILTGVVGSWIISSNTDWPTMVSRTSVIVAFLFSAAVGIFFGFYPARKASRLDPIDALRYE